MKRSLSVIAGVIVGIILVFIGDSTTRALNPPPVGINFMDKNVMNQYISTIPTYIFIIMVLFWLFSSFIGGMLAARLNRVEWRVSALITGSILMVAAILNLVMISHPVWMWIAVLAGYIPAALLGGMLGRAKPAPHD